MTIIWCIVPEIWSVADRIFCHFRQFFAFLSPNNPKNQNFEKMKKQKSRDIIILHMCTINNSQMMYGSWDIECDRQIFLSFWTIFCPFTYLTTQNIKILKKLKKHLEIYHFTHVYQKLWLDDVQFVRNGVQWMDGKTNGWTGRQKKWHRGGCPT